MSQIVHVQTTVTTVFGVLDDDGNVTPQPAVTGHLQKFSPEAFAEAHDSIAAERQKIAGEADPEAGAA